MKLKVKKKNQKKIDLFWLVKVKEDFEEFNNKKLYKVTNVTKDAIHLVPINAAFVKFTKEEAEDFYADNTFALPYGTICDVYGVHKFEFEKEKEVKLKNEFEKITNYKKSITELQKLRIEKEVEEIISRQFIAYEGNIVLRFRELAKKEIARLKKEGMRYESEFCEMTMSELSKKGIKQMTKENWHYCFEVNGKYWFQKLFH